MLTKLDSLYKVLSGLDNYITFREEVFYYEWFPYCFAKKCSGLRRR